MGTYSGEVLIRIWVLVWGNTLIDKKNQCCHESVLSVLQALTTFPMTSVTFSPHSIFHMFSNIFLKNFSCIIKTTCQDWYQHAWNWSSKSHTRTIPQVFLVFHWISSLGITCKSKNISHFRISNRPTERWNLFVLCHEEANLIFLEVNFVQLWMTICIIFLLETSFLGRKTLNLHFGFKNCVLIIKISLSAFFHKNIQTSKTWFSFN